MSTQGVDILSEVTVRIDRRKHLVAFRFEWFGGEAEAVYDPSSRGWRGATCEGRETFVAKHELGRILVRAQDLPDHLAPEQELQAVASLIANGVHDVVTGLRYAARMLRDPDLATGKPSSFASELDVIAARMAGGDIDAELR
jgi:hypothetical protein